MKVRELIEELGVLDPELEVHIAYNYGDHWRTIVAPEVKEVEEGDVEYSAYHSMDKMADEDTEDEKGDKGRRAVVILRT